MLHRTDHDWRSKLIRQYRKSISTCTEALPHTSLQLVADATGANAQCVDANPQVCSQRATILDLHALLSNVVLRDDLLTWIIQLACAFLQTMKRPLFNGSFVVRLW